MDYTLLDWPTSAKIHNCRIWPRQPVDTHSLFPLVRRISSRLTPVLGRSPLSANHISLLSLALGLAASWSIVYDEYRMTVIGGFLMVGCYVLDNCDGEIARLKGQSSQFGRRLDNFVDWAVDTALFIALGVGVAGSSGQEIWAWMGWSAAMGSTINYAIGSIAEERQLESGGAGEDVTAAGKPGQPGQLVQSPPETIGQWLMHVFRELSRADFCFILLGLALFGYAWVLLPLAAVGAHAFWAVHLLPGARERRV